MGHPFEVARRFRPDGRPPRLLHADRLVLVHVQKTAGTALGLWLRTFFEPDDCTPLDPHHMRQATWRTEGFDQGWTFLQGHVSFPVARQVVPDAHLLTVLREPVARVVSEYHHLRRWATVEPDVVEHEPVRRAVELDLLSFVESSPPGDPQANRMVRALGGHPRTPTGEDALERAERRLDALTWLGITEQYGRSLQLLCATFGLPREAAVVERHNVGPVDEAPDDEVRAAIAERDRLDVALYALAVERFERRCALAGIEP